MEKNPLDLNDDDDIVFIHSTVPTKVQNKVHLNLVSSDSSSASSSSDESESSDDFPDSSGSPGDPVDSEGEQSMQKCVVIEDKVDIPEIPKMKLKKEEKEDEEMKPEMDALSLADPVDPPTTSEPKQEKEIKKEKEPKAPMKSNPLSVKIRTYNKAHKQTSNLFKKSGPNKYTCQYCAKGCMHLETLERHMSKNHQDQLADKGNTCKLCKSKFKDPHLLTCHIKTHNLRFNCAICGRRFSSQKFLDIHVNIHFHEKEFPCELCEQGFSTSQELTDHYVWHEEQLA